MARITFETNLNVENFPLSSSSDEFKGFDVSDKDIGGLQLVWKNATSSDNFATKGQFDVQISNDGLNWNTLVDSNNTEVVIAVGAANGNVHVRLITIDFKWIRLKWTKNNSTGGTAKCFGLFKAQGF